MFFINLDISIRRLPFICPTLLQCSYQSVPMAGNILDFDGIFMTVLDTYLYDLSRGVGGFFMGLEGY